MKFAKMIVLASVTSSVFMMAGCSTTGYNDLSPTAKGATAGAAVGALIESGGNSKDIARGALAGAAVGGAGGYIYDKSKK